MNSDDVVDLLKRCASSMTESLRFYWPSGGKNDVPEVNITVHLGSVLGASGFLIYADAHELDNAGVRLDLLGLHQAKQTLVLGEFKRLWNPAMADAMVLDLGRVRAWRLAEARLRTEFRVAHRYGVLAATTWDDQYVEWFTDSAKRTTGPSSRGLGPLASAILGDDVRWGSILILKDAPVAIRGPTEEWLVYVVFPL